MAERTKLSTSVGDASGYLVQRAARARTGVVVIHEWWGVNEQIRRFCDRLAGEGFLVFGLDLFGGAVATDAEAAQQLMAGLDWRRVEQEARAAVQGLADRGAARTAVLGFCMGGAVTLLAAATQPSLNAAIAFYGLPPPKAGADLTNIRAAVQGHYAQVDDWCTPAKVDALEATLKSAGVKAELHRYNAAHAFFNEARPEVYSADCAQQAWDRALTFLRALP